MGFPDSSVGKESTYNAAAAKSIQSCPTLCDPVDYSLPGSSVHGDSPGKKLEVGCRVPIRLGINVCICVLTVFTLSELVGWVWLACSTSM